MPARNTEASYGAVSRMFHWLTALLILTVFPLGMFAESLPWATPEELARKAQAFSIHKTLGTLVFFVALARILWALTETRPAPLHPERRLETFAAEAVHWALYISLVAVPLSGWIHHAAVDGFAPILWPLGQGLPFVPKSESLAEAAATAHGLFTKLLLASLVLHVVGALKHVFIDRDETLARMTRGTPSQAGGRPHKSRAPMLAAVAVWALAGLGAWGIARPEAPEATKTAAASAPAGNWQVEEGSLSFTVRQMGSAVAGHFPDWSAEISFDETPDADGSNGSVRVTIDTTSLGLGAVTDQAKGADFFDTTNHPMALFTARIRPEGEAWAATGTLSLRGAERPVTLPFTLEISGDTAIMRGETTLDRRDFGIGANYTDESQVGFSVVVTAELTARRRD
ncbi:cytochrome b/b6 domain-containing protein [Pseudogemmobacter humi]|uniref:Lipid/polyisoprenoid-binding YceI-like domain-containing protein n=1 Tax=Pseudogemmobacter humi TaxID=2483812 RepID=A0A3P5XAN1_9RHOB|nr:cytochrome b/b6 domain-containing protein [Pseudogemmobacter humi]VDC31799.1 hypothetical protein XINFAN_03153 [Pseudogemmobacter humi]